MVIKLILPLVSYTTSGRLHYYWSFVISLVSHVTTGLSFLPLVGHSTIGRSFYHWSVILLLVGHSAIGRSHYNWSTIVPLVGLSMICCWSIIMVLVTVSEGIITTRLI